MSKKSILITGASSGLGAALAIYYAAPVTRLVLTGRNQSRLEEVAKLCAAKGADVEFYALDVTDQNAMIHILSDCDSRHPFDVVICNAGISGGTGGADLVKALQQSRNIFDVNMTGILNTLEPILPRMMERRRGQIALISSMASFLPLPNAPAYGASKTAVRAYGEALHGSLAKFNISVSVICPGFVKTRMTEDNRYPMPFLMDSNQAAILIADGLSRKKMRIIFPLPMMIIIYFLRLIPTKLLIYMMKKAPAKNALQER